MMCVRALLRSKVYVNGLHNAVTEGELAARGGEGEECVGEPAACTRYADELRELAGPFGDVVECHVKRDNGIRGR